MDFRQTTQPGTSRPVTQTAAPATLEHRPEKEHGGKKTHSNKWMQLLSVIIFVGIAILLLGIALAFTRTSNDNEAKFVNTTDYQAVFLTNGQVYFGNIDDLTSNYIRMTNIYYLTQSGDSTSSNYSLVKLGCQQIHDPLDEMVINRDQVSFWENLSGSGKVVSSIKQYQNQTKNESQSQLCSQVSTQTQASSSDTQGSTSTTDTSTTGTSTTGTSTTK